MESYGVLCRQASGEQIVVTVEAESAEKALGEVRSHIRLFYGGGDTAGRWLAHSNPSTLVEAGEVRPLPDWGPPSTGPGSASPGSVMIAK